MDNKTIFWILQCFWGVILAGAGFVIKRVIHEIDHNRQKIAELYKLTNDQGLKVATLTAEAQATGKELENMKTGSTSQMEEMKTSLKELRDEMKETLREIKADFTSQLKTVCEKIDLRNTTNHRHQQ